MKTGRFAILVFVLTMLAASHVSAQECGDVDGNGSITINDITRLGGYILAVVPIDSINQGNADCDGYVGVTSGDLNALLLRRFIGFGPLVCPPTADYTFPTSADTIFLPRWENIPDGVNRIEAPIRTNFSSSIYTVYLAFVDQGVGPDAAFELDSVYNLIADQNAAIFGYNNNYGDTTLAFLTSRESSFGGQHEYLSLVAKRVAGGPANFAPQLTDRSPLLRTCLSDANLASYLPVIAYYDYAQPKPQLLVAPTLADLNVVTGQPSFDTVQFDFTTDSTESLEFSLQWSSSWLRVLDYTEPDHTPATIRCAADALTLGQGEYADTIRIIPSAPGNVTVPVAEIPVTLTVQLPQVRPIGDLNCDGVLSLGDLSTAIYYLFINPGPVPPCP